MSAARQKLTENVWFWVYLFGVGALIALFLIGQKADQVQAQREENFTRRQHSLELQARASPVASPVDLVEQEDAEHAEQRYVDFTPFYTVLGTITVVAWCMLWRTHLWRRSASNLAEGPE